MKIVVLDGYTLNPGDNPWDEVASFGDLTLYDRTPAEMVVERSRGAQVLLTNKTVLSAATLAALPELRLVCVLATGYNVVDLEKSAQLGIPVVNVPEYGSDSVAQHAIALLLELTNRVAQYHQAVARGDWSASPDFTLVGEPLTELCGRSIGIVGLGRIGARVARIAQALGMEVLAYNPRHRVAPEGISLRWLSLDQLFSQADVVSLHCPLNDENEGMVNQRTLSLMKPQALLINTSRGGLVVERDLAEALNRGSIAGAAVDVAAREPIPADSPLLLAKNCIVTPHIAWATLAARRRLMAATAANIASFLAGKPQNVVNGVQ
ncbi:hydroxypyruvate reductase, putative [Citrifermentans bemidjiense Bem]|uniref:Hydroxypyruvate reductase, putative n=1 Tax=Citrifermentans bemidjiense (strain ATCC BAA-1014 / DSM 16622 / JCM 12645 / Bem) TaxID=404380 RepID=B5E9C4_CITBB|nr:D-2-hydroxyacid dehydrogenase [Citrifermentans bemidjiense]ACH38666.1 hydroxypyruvate reductase, putative [Citrifermentans bemidjiense Bem]